MTCLIHLANVKLHESKLAATVHGALPDVVLAAALAQAVQTLEDKGAAALRGVNVVLLGGTADNAASARLLPLTTAARSSLIYHPPHSSGSAAHFAFGGRNYTGCVGLLLHGLLHLREIPG